ncbi:MAG: putative transcriptional regulator [Candidatus Saccharibacteria bacterium]|nr:putative transcriptional regulator [Candidatus Saccharibacteria bacterium]
MIEQLFGSKTRVKLLQLFYSNPNRSFYVREITRKIDEQINSVRRELSNLLNIGIIVSDNNNNRLYYEVNQRFEYYEPLQQIFGGDMATAQAIVGSDKDALKQLGNVELAALTGQFTRDESTGVDVVLVGNFNQTQLNHYIADLEKQEGKELRFVVMSMDDYRYREQIKDRFVATLAEAKVQILVDKNNILNKE